MASSGTKLQQMTLVSDSPHSCSHTSFSSHASPYQLVAPRVSFVKMTWRLVQRPSSWLHVPTSFTTPASSRGSNWYATTRHHYTLPITLTAGCQHTATHMPSLSSIGATSWSGSWQTPARLHCVNISRCCCHHQHGQHNRTLHCIRPTIHSNSNSDNRQACITWHTTQRWCQCSGPQQ